MEEFDFTDDEIRDQLETLGYANIPTERLQQFKLGMCIQISQLINACCMQDVSITWNYFGCRFRATGTLWTISK